MRTHLLRTVALAVVTTACVSSAAPKLRIVGSVEGHKPREGWVYARKGQKVVLHAKVSSSRPPAQVRWYAIEPRSLALDNTTPTFHFERVAYGRREIEACRDQLHCPADVTPTWMPRAEGLEGLGTMAFQVEVTFADRTQLATPGVEAIDRGGLSRDVFRVAIRRDDSYLGYLTELVNTPYIFGSDGKPGRHQADLLVGSDCADLCVYAARRSGKDVPYVSTYTIDQHAPEVARAERVGPAGEMIDARGRPLRIGADAIRPGDLLLFPNSRHVGVLWEDRPPTGLLDPGDLMFHTCWAPPTVEAIQESRCASFPVRILRFR